MEICGAGAADRHTPAPDAGERGLVLGESEQVFGRICGRIGGGRMSPDSFPPAAHHPRRAEPLADVDK